jgi:hypothetical protein
VPEPDAPAGVEPKADLLRDARIIAPASVAQNEPMPPMITASNAKSSNSGPSDGDTVVRMPCSAPAMAISTKAMAVAKA